MDAVETVAVLGSGELGAGWALLCALARCAVRLHDPSVEAVERAAAAVRERVDAATGAGVLTRGERQRVLDGVLFTPDLEEAVTAADLAILAEPSEAHDPAPALAVLLRASALVAAAGGQPAAALAARLPHPGRVLGLRFVRTPGLLRRAELVAAPGATAHALARAAHLVERLNRAAGHLPPRR